MRRSTSRRGDAGYGGYGYGTEYPVERYYRDSRVTKFLSTMNQPPANSWNLLKRAAKVICPRGRAIMDEVMSASMPNESSGPAQAKRLCCSRPVQHCQSMVKIRDEQEVLMHLNNIVMEAFAVDTAVTRLAKKASTDIHRGCRHSSMTRRIEFSARQVLAAIAEGDNLRMQLAALRRLLRWTPINTVRSRQNIADFLTDSNRYGL